MRHLTDIPGKFYYLFNEKKDIDFQVRQIGQGVFTHYDVWKFSKDLRKTKFIGNYNESEFIDKFLKVR